MKKYTLIKNGMVYDIEEEYDIVFDTETNEEINGQLKYRVESLRCPEYSLNILANKVSNDDYTSISGTIIKEHYLGTPIELIDNITLSVNRQTIAVLIPLNGVVEFNIDIAAYTESAIAIHAVENDYVYGSIKI